MRITAYQQKGCRQEKKEMEDRIAAGGNVLSSGFHRMETEEDGIYGVFDGVGGMQGSAFASALAAGRMTDLKAPYTPEKIRAALQEAHDELTENSSTATTATGIAFSGDEAILFHIGNCRLYGLADGYIRQLTTDQTKYEDLLNAGRTPEEIPESAKCVINACLGARKELISQLVLEEIGPRIRQCSRLLFTSDGVHDYLAADDLEAALAGEITEESLRLLAEKAVGNGSEDDISIMAAER